MTRFLGHSLLLLLTICEAAFTAEPVQSSQVDAAVVKALLERIESDRAAERAAAAKELQELGPSILPHLPPPERIETAAARAVIVQVRNVLERQLATDSAQASHVTLQRTANRSELVKVIREQTKNSVTITNQETEPPLKVDWQSRPFWEAIDDLIMKSNHHVTWQPSTGSFVIEPRPVGQRPFVIAHAGAFRATAEVGKLKPLGGGDDQSVLRVITTWQGEPRLRPLFLRVKGADWHGTVGDETVTAWNPAAEYELPFADGTRQLSWPLDVIWPAASKVENWTLHGHASVHLAAMTETITFDPVALRPNVQRRRGGVAVRIQRVDFRPSENGKMDATIRIHVAYDTGGPAFESHRSWIFYQSAYLLNSKSERIAFTDYDATQQADGAVGVEYHFHNLPGRNADYRFCYEAPTLFLDVPLDVDFRGLTMPER